MTPSPPRTLRIYGTWTNETTVEVPGRTSRLIVHTYDCPIAPWDPITIGQRIQLIAVVPVAHRILIPPLVFNDYDVYDPQIVGRVVGGYKQDEGRMIFAVENERILSPTSVGLAVIAVPYIPGFSRMPEDDECPRVWMKKLLMGVRSLVIPLGSAVVRDTLGVAETPIRALQYPDPREDVQEPPPEEAERVWRPWAV